jgi:hypothetical protein
MPMDEVKTEYGERFGILGGVDTYLLSSGTPDAVRRAARQAIEDGWPGGGYAFGSGNAIANYIPLESHLHMLYEAQAA